MSDAGGSSSSLLNADAASPNKPPVIVKKSSSSSSSSSSIGKNSDDDTAAGGGDEVDSQPPRAGGFNLDTLEDALPIRKGLSVHHEGRMKSYINLADASSDSSITLPADPYSKKRKNRIAREIHLAGMGQGPRNKKPTNASRSTAPINVGSGTNSQDDKSTDSSSGDEKTCRTTEQGP